MFNYGLTRARKIVECAFGILTAKFKIFAGPICCKEETAISIVKASVVLRNFIRIRDGVFCEVGESFAVSQPFLLNTKKVTDGRDHRGHIFCEIAWLTMS
jgi:hypothetical protein